MNIKILDCSLRDGGYVNNWEFGENASSIVRKLSNANIDIIEMGFLRDGKFKPEQTLYNRVEDVFPRLSGKEGQEYSLMIRPDWYDIKQLDIPADKISLIRFAFYLKDKELTERYADYVRNKGYKVSLNAVNICSYSEGDLLELVKYVNQVHPEIMMIVDTFGSLTIEYFEKIYKFFNANIEKDIAIGCHLHENMLLSSAIVQRFFKIGDSERKTYLDGSLNGIGRIPGNLPLEILVDLVNSFQGIDKYNEMEILKAISNFILPIKEKSYWGYSPAFYHSGKLKVHRSYPEYYLSNRKVGLDGILNMLLTISKSEKRWGFDKVFANQVYNDYISK